MLRLALALALGFTLVGLSGVAADDKKDDKKKTVEGKLVCSKCKLSETEKCGNAVVVKEKVDGKEKEVTYYLEDKGQAEKYHKCTGEKDVKVTGKVVEKDKKKYIQDAKVEDAKKTVGAGS
ncbi:MAG: hypothetical protein K2X87_01365 [Gemmataceae bacterium]|nr:hypothetical protein [Gemmataceae bacterium]